VREHIEPRGGPGPDSDSGDSPEDLADRVGHAAEPAWATYEVRAWNRWLSSMIAGPDPRVASAALELREALNAMLRAPDREADQ
jgi:hypothetical protein